MACLNFPICVKLVCIYSILLHHMQAFRVDLEKHHVADDFQEVEFSTNAELDVLATMLRPV